MSKNVKAHVKVLLGRCHTSVDICVVQAEYHGALHGSMHDAQQASIMSASLAKTNWINSGLRSQVVQTPYMLCLL